jgi:hypothetical protein
VGEGQLNIACLGWGSLVWKPGDLPVQREWFRDGPAAPVEFLRQSNGGRITLVLDESGKTDPVTLLWALMSPDKIRDVETAAKALAKREGSPLIGRWSKGQKSPPRMANLGNWAASHSLDAVVWTALGAKFGNVDGKRPTASEVVDFLRARTGTEAKDAEDYVRLAPRQIQTPYRRRIEEELGWSCTAE